MRGHTDLNASARAYSYSCDSTCGWLSMRVCVQGNSSCTYEPVQLLRMKRVNSLVRFDLSLCLPSYTELIGCMHGRVPKLIGDTKFREKKHLREP
eukprot:6191947-Pleurochrysis_carterae.AAC.4